MDNIIFQNNEERLQFLEEKPFPLAITIEDGKLQTTDFCLEEIPDLKTHVKIKNDFKDENRIQNFHTKLDRSFNLYGITKADIDINFSILLLFSAKIKGNFEKNNTNFESNSNEETYNYEDSVTQHFYVDINKDSIKIKKEFEKEIEKICFDKNDNTNKQRLEELDTYLQTIGYFVPLRLYYGSRFTKFSTEKIIKINDNKKDTKTIGAGIGAGLGSLQSNTNILSFNKETSKNSKNDSLKKITESYSTSFGSGICIDTKDVYKSSINKNNYDVVFVKNVKCILEFLDIELKEKIYYLIQSTYNNQIKIQNGYDTIYLGHLINGVRDGYGTLGDINYKGFWKNGKREGYGIQFYNSEIRHGSHKGYWKEDKEDGFGIRISDDCNITTIKGVWKDGKLNGYAYYYISDLPGYSYLYEGNFKNWNKDGYGILTIKDRKKAEKYEGYWKDDQKDGIGIYYYNDGNKYEGSWKNNKRDGLGTLYKKKGQIIQSGIWSQDKIVSQI